jgi:hypothetical protein
MIEATCAACGTVARIAEADVPAGAKFINCASCKSRVPLPGRAATPARGVRVPSIPIPKIAPPIPPKQKADELDLADLPAPKRNSPLGGSDGGTKPAPRSALADAELPVPKGAKPPAPAPGPLDLDDLMPSDLPAPKPKADLGLTDLPAPKPKASALADLPAPKAKQASALADLPAPKAKPGPLADLPAPKAKPAAPAPVAAKGFDDDLDLPAPKASGLSDLPAPKGFFDDLPQPAKPKAGSIDLPAP